MNNQKVPFPQSKVSSKELPEDLTGLGAKVVILPVCQTVEMEPVDIDSGHNDKILFTGGSTVRAFVKKFSKAPSHIKACHLGFPTHVIAKETDIDAEILVQ